MRHCADESDVIPESDARRMALQTASLATAIVIGAVPAVVTRDHHGKVLLFAHDLSVPHTNNQAERDLRPAKTQIKISGCHRSEKGVRAWLTVRAHISTLRKNGINMGLPPAPTKQLRTYRGQPQSGLSQS